MSVFYRKRKSRQARSLVQGHTADWSRCWDKQHASGFPSQHPLGHITPQAGADGFSQGQGSKLQALYTNVGLAKQQFPAKTGGNRNWNMAAVPPCPRLRPPRAPLPTQGQVQEAEGNAGVFSARLRRWPHKAGIQINHPAAKHLRRVSRPGRSTDSPECPQGPRLQVPFQLPRRRAFPLGQCGTHFFLSPTTCVHTWGQPPGPKDHRMKVLQPNHVIVSLFGGAGEGTQGLTHAQH